MYFGINIFLVVLAYQCLFIAGWKVINGTQAIMHEYPQLVSLRIEGEHECGGTLLNENTVLTAAHCVWEIKDWSLEELKYNKVQVVLGEYDLHQMYGYEKFFQVIRVIIPEVYDNEMAFLYGNDVALIKFNGSVSNTQYDYIKHTLLDKSSITRPGKRCVVVGWGSMLPSGIDTSQFLRKANIDILSNEECAISFNNVRNTKSNICAGSGRLSTSSCRGDSGGPLFCKNSLNQHVQVGIVSYGRIPCGQPNIPTVFTRVSAVIPWISRNSAN